MSPESTSTREYTGLTGSGERAFVAGSQSYRGAPTWT